MRATCIIPARGGSQRIKLKNVRPFHGKPIIEYSIRAAQASHLFDDIIVSSDSIHIGALSSALGATWHPRHERHAHNDIGTQEVTRVVINDMYIQTPLVCVMYAAAPMVTANDLKIAAEMLCNDSRIDYVVPVGEWLKDPGQWYFGRLDAFYHGHPLLGTRTRLMPIDPRRAVDINTEEDWALASQRYRDLINENTLADIDRWINQWDGGATCPDYPVMETTI